MVAQLFVNGFLITFHILKACLSERKSSQKNQQRYSFIIFLITNINEKLEKKEVKPLFELQPNSYIFFIT